MPDEELDKLITDAANQHYPSYNDKDWDNMLVLLNKHLPEKKDRKRPFIFWLLPLLLVTGVLISVLQPWKKSRLAEKNNTTAGINTQHTIASTNGKPDATATTGSLIDRTDSNSPQVITEKRINTSVSQNIITSSNDKLLNKTAVTDDNTYFKSSKVFAQQKAKTKVKVKKPGVYTNEAIANSSNPVDEGSELTATLAKADSETPLTDGSKNIKAEILPKQNEENKIKDSAANKTVNTEAPTVKAIETNRKQEKKSTEKNKGFASNFAITASVGADVSFVGLGRPGKTKFMYGIGAAYNAGKHLRISTGFFAGSKKYTAAPSQYKFPAGTLYPYIDKVVADCRVYEIPLNVYYNFKQQKNQSWFGGAGLSSFLMKKEDYEYQYKYPSGQTHSYYKSYNNENRHFLSVITLSGGWQYNVSQHITFIAEPYIKLPLSGVGAGKVRLNSTGILFTTAVKPFKKNK